MTEREKMGQGLLYDANYDTELLKARENCKDLCFSYNQLKPSQISEQEKLIRRLFGKTGKRFYITAHSGVTTDAILRLGKISTPITTASFLTEPRLHLVIMFSLLQTVSSPLPVIH